MKKKILILLIIIIILIAIYKIFNIENIILKHLYPIKYEEYVTKYSNELNIDPMLS